jgi:hypothetical protein
MAAGDLISLAAVKAWLSVQNTNDDTLLSRLISQVSRSITNITNRPGFLPANYTEVGNGIGGTRLMLRNWPVISVASVTIGGHAIPASSALIAGQTYQRGWILDPSDSNPADTMQAISLRGWEFWPGQQNVIVSYTAGYQITAEPQTVPAPPGPYTLSALAPLGDWGSDAGVTYANGTSLVAVTGAPGPGQYAVTAGLYTFNIADAGAAVAPSYGYIPADLAEACMEIVAERYRYKDRIGVISKSIGGQEVASFSQKGMSDFVAGILNGYKRVVPC